MPVTTLAGHPLHPQLVGLPIGMLSFSWAMDALYELTGDRSYADAAYYAIFGGCATAMAAGAAGAVDYLDIPPDSQSKKTANAHVLLNLGVMGVWGLNLLARKGRTPPSGGLGFLLSTLGTAGLIVSQWYGGKLVYDLGMRVKPATEGGQGTELKPPADRQLQRAFERLEKTVAPAGGPHV
jgi:uncharacterized membrane protein